MKTFNVRLGHACNSSSTHSIVPLAALGGVACDDYEGGEFGWSHFMLASPAAKMEYLAATLSERIDASKITALTGIERDPHDNWHDGFGYVDHQSQMALPVEGPFAELFLQDLAEYLRRDDVVVLGGNDNGGRMTAAHLPLETESVAPKLRPGLAPDGTRYWTVMDRYRGDRTRFSFHGQPLSGPGSSEYGIPAVSAEPLELPYADEPELVDMKVTAYCPFEKDCPWCYMGSTRAGSHASWEDASAYLQACAAAGVFEVALGGGEPTLWPHLDDLVALADAHDINVNLTTKNIAWLGRDEFPGIKAVAVSVNNERDLERLAALELRAYGKPEFTIQTVPAFCDDALLTQTIALAADRHLRITFLGVKRTGRAAAEERQDDLRWLELLKEHKGSPWLRRGVAVDTLMAAAAEEAFEALGVDPVWYETTEGRFSCYIDATAQQLAPSSYAEPYLTLGFPPGADLGVAFRDAQWVAGLRAEQAAA